MKCSLHRTLLVASAGLVMLALVLECTIQGNLEQVHHGLPVDLETARTREEGVPSSACSPLSGAEKHTTKLVSLFPSAG